MNAPIPDQFARTARLLVKITNGQCTLADGCELPKMKADVTAELVISPWDITDEAEREKLMEEQRVDFLPEGSVVWARVKDDHVPDELAKFRKAKRCLSGPNALFVGIKITDSVQLVVRGDGRASLGDCCCTIPALPDQSCSSINEAYTRISESFEPSRRSHTGNVFNCVFVENGDFLHPLRRQRDKKLEESTK